MGPEMGATTSSRQKNQPPEKEKAGCKQLPHASMKIDFMLFTSELGTEMERKKKLQTPLGKKNNALMDLAM
jgi:hypothetical protein